MKILNLKKWVLRHFGMGDDVACALACRHMVAYACATRRTLITCKLYMKNI